MAVSSPFGLDSCDNNVVARGHLSPRDGVGTAPESETGDADTAPELQLLVDPNARSNPGAGTAAVH